MIVLGIYFISVVRIQKIKLTSHTVYEVLAMQSSKGQIGSFTKQSHYEAHLVAVGAFDHIT